MKTDKKASEITAIPQLLDLLPIYGVTITIDAIGCQTKIAEKIISKKANYVLAIKRNQKKLHADIVRAFSFVDENDSPFCTDTLNTVEKDHGSIEFRKHEICY